MKTKIPDLNHLNSADPNIKYGTAKELLQIATEEPALLVPNYDDWVRLMKSPNNILKWTAIEIIGHLSQVDPDNRSERQLKTLVTFLRDGKLITANHAISALGLIAMNKTRLRNKIIKALLAIRDYEFETEECKAIATGKVLEVLYDFLPEINNNKDALAFIKEAQNSQRNATRKKAGILQKKIKKV